MADYTPHRRCCPDVRPHSLAVPLIVLLLVFHLANPAVVFPAITGKDVRIPMADELASEPTVIVFASGIVSHEIDPSGKPKRRLVPQVVLALWEDGTIVWSKDDVRGGAPYFMDVVDPETVNDALSRMCEAAAALPDLTRTEYVGLSAPWSTIAVKSETCNIYWDSWHEIFEESGRSVCVDGLIRPLAADETVEEARARSSPEFLAFLHAWETVKDAAMGLIPEPLPEPEEVPISFRTNWTTIVLDP